MNVTETPLITVPLGGEVHRLARQLAAQQATVEKGKQVYLHTLAVQAVHSYLKWLQVETDLSQGGSWYPNLRSPFNFTDLVLPHIGKLGCCPLLPGETTCSLPFGVMADRIGYVVVELDQSLREATVLGFTPVTMVEQLAINQLQPIDQFIDYLGQLVQPVTASQPATSSRTPVSQWLQNLFEAGWQSLEALLSREPDLVCSFRSNLEHEAVKGAKLVDLGLQLGSQFVMLLVAVTQVEEEVGILVQVHPVGLRTYLPPRLKLGLLSQSGETLQMVQSRTQDNYIQLRGFQGSPGEILCYPSSSRGCQRDRDFCNLTTAMKAVMNKLVVLSLGAGDLENGFPAIIAQLSEPGTSYPVQSRGSLPAVPEIPKLYRSWQLLYKAVHYRPEWRPRMKINAAGITNVSRAEFGDLCQQLSNKINAWLNSEPFRNIDQQLRTKLDAWDEIRFVVATDDIQLRRLPWHLWNFFEDFPKAEVAFSASEYQRSRKLPLKNLAAKVRILAVLGNSKGIDIEADRTFLEQLSKQAETEFLVEPQLEQLNDQLWQDWDIFYFAGHSTSQDKGLLQLNQTDSLTLDQLKYALKKAVEKGLKLAIFNSCDGLGLAQRLADLQIPQVIVMREPVPDIVAQKFLRQFLTSFSEGKTLYASMREARERLQGLERDFPCASWLPVICQNPTEESSTWQKWCTPKQDGFTNSSSSQRNRQTLPSWRHMRMALIASLVVTALVMGVRYLGLLQAWELQGFDQLMRLRPSEGQDQRLLIINITEEDFQLPEQKQRKGSLSDLALARLLEKLESYQPRAIGLDIYHADSVAPTQAELATRIQNHDGFFAICKVQDRAIDHPGIAPPPEVPAERQGFSDIVKDPDGILRRHLLAMQPSPASPCTTPYALSAQLAFHYLEAEGITASYTQKGDLQLGNVVFKRLQAPMGGYQQADTWGYQVLLNYRSYRSPLEIAPRVTLTDILTGVVKPDEVKGRIVLIGVSAQSAHDYIPTPYSVSQGVYQEMPGVVVQAQMVSQILSAVKDGRPLLVVWPLWGEVLWVWVWSVVGGFLVWYYQAQRRLVLVGVASLGVLYVLCFGLLIQGKWIPLVPSALALVITGGSVGVYLARQHQRQQSSSSLRHG